MPQDLSAHKGRHREKRFNTNIGLAYSLANVDSNVIMESFYGILET